MAQQESSAFSAVLGDPIPVLDISILTEKSTKTRINWFQSSTRHQIAFRASPEPRFRPHLLIVFVLAVLQHLDFLKRNEPAAYHLFEHRQQFPDFFLTIHDLNDQGQVRREAPDLC